MTPDLLEYPSEMVDPGMIEMFKELSQDQFWTYQEMCFQIVEEKLHLAELETILGSLCRNYD